MEQILPLIGFAIATSVRPGPGGLMLAASAANNGVLRTIPAILGLAVGFAAMLMLVGLGLAGPFATYYGLHVALKWLGAAWLIYLAFRLVRHGMPGQDPDHPPIGFLGAILLQLVNGRSWLVALAAVPAYTGMEGDQYAMATRLALVFLVVSVPCNAVWAFIGVGARHWLDKPGELHGFNIAMAVLLIASLVPMFW